MLATGTTLGPYRILAPIGAGGMGEVYRAHDTRLGRDVAVKVLSPHLASTSEVRSRFEREARAISQLNHPNVCTLYDIGREGDTDYLVMELLEGKTLAHRLEKGPLSGEDVLALGTQIAEALDAAHRHGIVHRDLKPGNIMLTKGGAKLMDFGLARASPSTPVTGAVTESPTVTRPLTTEGTIVGTFQYMAPEQLEGKEADGRSDIWALGCVLYEMATGKRAFAGTSQASLIAAILKETPRPITEQQPLTPPALDHLIRRCLAKDAADRWQSARDLTHQLTWIAEARPQADIPSPMAARRRNRERLASLAAIAALAVAVVALLLARLASRPSVPPLSRLTVTLPENTTIPIDEAMAAISPDGRQVAFVLRDSLGGDDLWIRPLDSISARPLTGTKDANLPFWSPDGRFIAFFAGGKLRKVPAGGGSPETICDAPQGRGGSWNEDDVIVFAPVASGLRRVSPDGAEDVTVARPDSTRGETGLGYPCFLPDGRHFLYVGLPKKKGQFDVYVGDLDSKETRHVMTAASAPVYAEPGFLLFARDGRLVAQRFDRSRLRPTGEVVPLCDAPPPLWSDNTPYLSPPAKGVLACVAARTPDTQLTWLDRSGRPTGTVPLPPGRYVHPSLSPDGRRVAVMKLTTEMAGDLWVVDLERAVPSRLTFDGSVLRWRWPWSPDGSRIAYERNSWDISDTVDASDMYMVPANGTGRPESLLRSRVQGAPEAWSPDGKYIIYCEWSPTSADLCLLPTDGERRSLPYLRTPYWEQVASISPDGRWLAYCSNESGDYELYVRSFPVPGEKYPVSASGAYGVQWSGDGRELLIGTGCPQGAPISSVDVETAPTFRAGTPRRLFTARPDIVGITATRDLQRFLAAVPVEGSAPPSVTVILNWEEALGKASR